MAEYRNLNPTAPQSMAQIVAGLRQKAESSKTGSHGQKDMGSTGNSYWTRPDGSVVSVRDVDSDLQAAQGRIDEAAQELLETAQRASDAKAAAEAAEDRLDDLDETTLPAIRQDIEAAAGQASADLTELEGKLDAAQSELDAAEAGLAQLGTDLATEADARAQLAQNVQSDFNDLGSRLDTFGDDPALSAMRAELASATSAATAAQGTADAAVTAANAANQAALQAAGIADAKGKVIFSDSEPTGDDRNPANLWIQPSTETTHVFNESSGTWEEVTSDLLDQAAQNAIDAKNTANQAQQTADTAIANAESAMAAAKVAESAADEAQRTADGKNTVTTSEATPSGSGDAAGDVWFKVDGSGKIVGQWTWTGAAWNPQEVGSEVIANLDVGKLTAGDAALREAVIEKLWVDGLVGKTAIFNQISVASGNLLVDPQGLNPELRDNVGGALWVWDDAGKYWTRPAVQGGTTQYNAYTNVGSVYDSNLLDPGAMYVLSFEVWVDTVGPDTAARASIYYKNRDGSTSFVGDAKEEGGDDEHWQQPMLAGQWNKVTRHWRAPDDVLSGGFNFQLMWGGDDSTEVRVRNPFVGKQAASVMIEDGAVNAQKVSAESVAGAVGQFIELSTDQLVAGSASIGSAVAQRFWADIATFNEVTADKVVVGGVDSDALADGAVGAVVIQDGAVSTPKLNVTEQMSAAIVDAMSITSKKLVVTDEAILNHATLLGTTVVEQINVQGKIIGVDGVFTGTVDFANLNVTGEAILAEIAANSIDASKIDVSDLAAEIVMAGLVQTGTSGRRVEMKPAGIAAYNSAGQKTVSINGNENFLSGTISTARQGQPGAILTPTTAGGSGVWFSQDGSLGSDQAAVYSHLDGNIHIRPKDSVPLGTVFIDGNLIVDNKTTFNSSVTATSFNTTGSANVGTLRVDGNGSVGGDFYVDTLKIYHPGSASGSANARINSDGSVTIASSSRRYKENIEDWEPDPSAVLALRARSWVPKDEDPDLALTANGRYVGFVAEEVEQTGLTDLVSYSLDEDGSPRPEALNYDRFAAAHQSVLRKHESEIQSLKNENDGLRDRLASLEAKMQQLMEGQER